jgi:hypothetical protein
MENDVLRRDGGKSERYNGSTWGEKSSYAVRRWNGERCFEKRQRKIVRELLVNIPLRHWKYCLSIYN